MSVLSSDVADVQTQLYKMHRENEDMVLRACLLRMCYRLSDER